MQQPYCTPGDPACEGWISDCPRCGDKVCEGHAEEGLCLACQDDAVEVMNGLRGANLALEVADKSLAGVLADLDALNAGMDELLKKVNAFVAGEAEFKRRIA